jgi:hypothetical protein
MQVYQSFWKIKFPPIFHHVYGSICPR